MYKNSVNLIGIVLVILFLENSTLINSEEVGNVGSSGIGDNGTIFSKRSNPACVVFNNRMWVIGGYDDERFFVDHRRGKRY